MEKHLKCLVLDSGAFIRTAPCWEYADELYSVKDVLTEIKDREAQDYVAAYPVKVIFREPSVESCAFIEKFTKISGDYYDLSAVDLKILALTYELEVQYNGVTRLRSEPLKRVTNTMVTVPLTQNVAENKEQDNLLVTPQETFELNKSVDDLRIVESDENSSDATVDWTTVSRGKNKKSLRSPKIEDDLISTLSKSSSGRGRIRLPGFGEEGDEDSDGGWVNPDNIEELNRKYEKQFEECGDICDFDTDDEDCATKPMAGCITGDFTVQNVLKNIGLTVLGVDGKIIREIRTQVLRCYACFHVTSDRSKLFCPRCGNLTLKRVSVTVNPDGSQQIWISRKSLNTRGIRYNLPKPRGGQHAILPLLTSDQRFPYQWPKKSKKVDALSEDYVARTSPFSIRDVNSRAAQHAYNTGERGIKGQLRYAKIWQPKKTKMVKKCK